jgi:hypothetical protein
MKQFNVNDADGITEYLKSLDVCDQFDEVTVDLLRRDSIDDNRVHEVRISIESLDMLIYTLQKHRDFVEPIFEFSKYFEQDIKFLSAAVLFLRRLQELDETLTDLKFDFKDFCVSLIASNETEIYTLNALVNSDNEPVASIVHEFKSDNSLMTFTHSSKTKSAIKVDKLASVVEEFNRLKFALASKGS